MFLFVLFYLPLEHCWDVCMFCFVLFTVQLGIILGNDQLDTQLFCFTIRLL